MSVAKVRKIIDEILERYEIGFSEVVEERKEGKIKFVTLIAKFKVEEKKAPRLRPGS